MLDFSPKNINVQELNFHLIERNGNRLAFLNINSNLKNQVFLFIINNGQK